MSGGGPGRGGGARDVFTPGCGRSLGAGVFWVGLENIEGGGLGCGVDSGFGGVAVGSTVCAMFLGGGLGGGWVLTASRGGIRRGLGAVGGGGELGRICVRLGVAVVTLRDPPLVRTSQGCACGGVSDLTGSDGRE